MCPNCGAAALPLGATATSRSEAGCSVGCLPLLIAALDVFFVPFAFLMWFGAGDIGFRLPIWALIAYFALQGGLLAFLIYRYRAAVIEGIGPRTRGFLLTATIIAALLLGLGTACNISVMSNTQ